jgi:hypothetical protein
VIFGQRVTFSHCDFPSACEAQYMLLLNQRRVRLLLDLLPLLRSELSNGVIVENLIDLK